MRLTEVQCSGCRSSQPVTPRIQAAGWYRCRYCGTPHATPVAPHEVFEGPESETVVLVRPGALRFVLPRGLLIDRRTFLGGAFVLGTIAVFIVGTLQMHPQGHWAREWVAPLVALAGALAVFVLWRARASEQHLELTPREVRFHRAAWGWRTHQRVIVRGPGELRPRLQQGSPHSWGDPKTRVELGVGGTGGLRLTCSGDREGRWITGLVADFLDGGMPRQRCYSCGASLPTGWKERAETRVSCTYCDAGFIVDGEGVSSAPVVLPRRERSGMRPSLRVRERASRQATRWTIHSGERATRAFFGSGLFTAATFFGGFAGLSWSVLVPVAWRDDKAGFALFLLLGGVMFLYVAVFAALAAWNVLAGSTAVAVGRAVVERGLLLSGRTVPSWMQLGGWVMYRRLLGMNPYAQRELNIFSGFKGAAPRRLALMRLSRVTFGEEEGLRVVTLHSAALPLVIRWDLGVADDAWLCARLIEELSLRLDTLKRRYEYTDDS